MEEKLIGIVLNKTEYKENDLIINLFTLEKGMITASLKGVKKAGAKLKFASEPFCFAEFLFSEKNGRRTITGASLNDSFYPLREDISKFFAGASILEFIRKFVKESVLAEDLFFLVVDKLKELAYGDKGAREVLSAFLADALKFSGYAINTDGCFCCGKDITGRVYFDPSSGGFLCEKCFNGTGREINHITYTALAKTAAGERISEEESVFVLRLLDFYMVNKLEENIKPLKELLNF